MFSNPYFWTGLSLLMFMGVFIWKGLKPLQDALDARGEKIRQEIEDAQKLREEAQHLLSDYKQRHQEALKEAEDIIEHAKAEALRLKAQAEQDLTELMARREQIAIEKIRQAELDALKELRHKTITLATQAAAEALPESLNAGKQASLTDKALAEIKKSLQ